jgi:hypothetical protein
VQVVHGRGLSETLGDVFELDRSFHTPPQLMFLKRQAAANFSNPGWPDQ